jgi:maleate isomerase
VREIAARIGLIVPPANPAVEVEFAELLPEGAALHTARLPVLPGDLAARLAGYRKAFDLSLDGFGDLAIDAYCLGVTGASYALGHEGDASLCAELGGRKGKPVATGSLAIAAALSTLGVRSIGLVSPYPAWLTEQAARYWRGAGIEVAWIESMGETFRAYEIETAEVEAVLSRVRAHRCEAIVVSGTGLMTLPALEKLAPASATPILTSNACAVWWVCRALGLGYSSALETVANPLTRCDRTPPAPRSSTF